MGEPHKYYIVTGVQEFLHLYLYRDFSVGFRCDGSREDIIGKGKTELESQIIAENYSIGYLRKLGPEMAEFGEGNGWLGKYLVEDWLS